MSDQVFNLDDGVAEYTPFILLGHKYKFKQFNTDEATEIMRLGNDEKVEELQTKLGEFIIPEEGSPTYEEIKGKMLIGHHQNLKKMIYTIMGIDENKSPKDTTSTA